MRASLVANLNSGNAGRAWRSETLALAFALVVLLAGHFVGAILVLVWMKLSRITPGRLGFRRPASWPRTIVLGAVGGAALKLLTKTLLMPVLGFSANNAAYQYLVGNRPALIGLLFTVIVGGGFGEELIWRGFLFERLGKVVPSARVGPVTTIVVTSLLFAAAHYADQGVPGVVQAGVTGVIFGTVYLSTRSLALPMILHGSFDVTAVLIIYFNLESRLSHLFFAH